MSYSSKENGLKASNKRQRVNIYMDKELKKKIDKRAAAIGMNRSEYVNNVLEKDINGQYRRIKVVEQ